MEGWAVSVSPHPGSFFPAPAWGCKPKPPKIPSSQIQSSHDCIQVYDIRATAPARRTRTPANPSAKIKPTLRFRLTSRQFELPARAPLSVRCLSPTLTSEVFSADCCPGAPGEVSHGTDFSLSLAPRQTSGRKWGHQALGRGARRRL